MATPRPRTVAHASDAGRLLKGARGRAHLTQAELARRLGVTQAAVAQLERPASNPRVATLDRALRALGAELVMEARARDETVDESLIGEQLALTPQQRLENLERMYQEARELADAGARARDELG